MNILIVDDDEMVRFVLTEKLTESGFTTAAVGDGLSAIELFHAEKFDAVLLDLKMPGMDGIETLKELLLRDPEVPVVMVTAFGDVATAVEAIKIGAYDFVEKPPQISRIVLTLKHALEKGAFEREIRELGKSAAETSLLKQANDKLIELDRIKTAFLCSVSHELRTPLTSIIGFAEINRSKLARLALQLSDPKGAREIGQAGENLEIMVTEARRLAELVDDLLELTALEAGTATWNRAPLFVQEMVAEAVAAQTAAYGSKGVGLVTEIAQDLPPITGDRDKLCLVLKHLLSNALKFTERGLVTCSAVRCGHAVRIEVSDTGSGIPDALQTAVFEKFRQLGETLTDKPKGVGLGLPICKLIVEHHGGSLSVASEPGKGSVFGIVLACGEEPEP